MYASLIFYMSCIIVINGYVTTPRSLSIYAPHERPTLRKIHVDCEVRTRQTLAPQYLYWVICSSDNVYDCVFPQHSNIEITEINYPTEIVDNSYLLRTRLWIKDHNTIKYKILKCSHVSPDPVISQQVILENLWDNKICNNCEFSGEYP
ncbi:IL-18 binding protein [Sea otter poxvirus]|uniref:IL-18 binding protein n=1 Tax=Sea otter poxvirus TaxID=1416741 RepID=A0A2U9QHG9_9POXV|nr:IL-18 binding protein [Sea otter poxvirus]AWU47048.1 IL-18 binding protein [Sea otter poxvirus]